MYNPTNNSIAHATEITRLLTSVVFDSIDVWAYGEEDDLFIRFKEIPIAYVWDMRFFILKIEYYDFEATISHSLLSKLSSAWHTCPAVNVFCQLALAARECDEQGVPYVFYIRDGDPHDTFTSWGEERINKLNRWLFMTRIYPRRRQ